MHTGIIKFLSCVFALASAATWSAQHVSVKQLHALEVLPTHISLKSSEFAEGMLSADETDEKNTQTDSPQASDEKTLFVESENGGRCAIQ